MKLLILTQKVNRDDPILGFFCRWITEFSKHFESVRVIVLEVESNTPSTLPNNVKVFSLGKDKKIHTGFGKINYILRFYKYIWSLRDEYDAVFVHMNQEYILLGYILWKILKKKIYMWRNHYSGNYLTKLSVMFCNNVFCTSKYSYTAQFKKTVIMPVGIDTDFFVSNPSIRRKEKSILSLGRISSSKNIDLFVDALLELYKEGIDFYSCIYGDALPKEYKYKISLMEKVSASGCKNIEFRDGIPNYKTPEIYSAFDIFINLSPSGMYDKTMFEAAACGCQIVALNQDLILEFGPEYVVEKPEFKTVVNKLKIFLSEGRPQKNLREITIQNQSLSLLAKRLKEEMK